MSEEPTTGWHLWRLRVGDKIRISAGQPVRQVVRVTLSAAYYEVIKENTYKVFDTTAGEHVEITRKDSRVEYISSYAYVEMIERGPVKLVKRVEAAPVARSAPRAALPPIEYKTTKRQKR
jgi:hypothetical protein